MVGFFIDYVFSAIHIIDLRSLFAKVYPLCFDFLCISLQCRGGYMNYATLHLYFTLC